MGCSFVGLTATLAAFWRRKPSGGPDLHPERQRRAEAAAEDGEGRLFCFAMESAPLERAGK
jgi:hypothetical protein